MYLQSYLHVFGDTWYCVKGDRIVLLLVRSLDEPWNPNSESLTVLMPNNAK